MSLTTASPATVARPTSHRRGNPWWTLACVALGVIMVGIDGSVVAIANPYIARSLHASLADLQWVTNAYLLALAVLLVAGGKLGDRYGRRLVYLIGVAASPPARSGSAWWAASPGSSSCAPSRGPSAPSSCRTPWRSCAVRSPRRS